MTIIQGTQGSQGSAPLLPGSPTPAERPLHNFFVQLKQGTSKVCCQAAEKIGVAATAVQQLAQRAAAAVYAFFSAASDHVKGGFNTLCEKISAMSGKQVKEEVLLAPVPEPKQETPATGSWLNPFSWF